MSEPATTPTSPPAPAQPEQPTVPESSDSNLGEAGKRALDAERRAKAVEKKRADALEARLKAIEERDLSDLEKAKKATADVAAELAAVRSDATRYKIAAQHGITEEDAERFLVGTDEASMTAAAVRLKELYAAEAAASASTPGPSSPRPDLSQGARSTVALNSDPLLQDLIAKVGARPRR